MFSDTLDPVMGSGATKMIKHTASAFERPQANRGEMPEQICHMKVAVNLCVRVGKASRKR